MGNCHQRHTNDNTAKPSKDNVTTHTTTSKPSSDFNFFLNDEINDSNNCAVSECKAVQRVSKALKYYESLNNTKNENENSNGQAIFSAF